jgi:hypothetical protein
MKQYQFLIDAANRILSEFDYYGEVLQVGPKDKDGNYGPTSSIERLQKAVKKAGGA